MPGVLLPAGRSTPAASRKRPAAAAGAAALRRQQQQQQQADGLSELEDADDDVADDNASDSDYAAERDDWQKQQQEQQQQQRQRKRLRRSGEVTAAPAVAHDAGGSGDPAELIARHRSRVMQGCDECSSDEGAAAVAGGTINMQAAYCAPPELDCFVDDEPAAAAAAATSRGAAGIGAVRQSGAGGNSRLSNVSSSKGGPRSGAKPSTQQQQKQKQQRGKGSAVKHDASQAKLEMFFSATPAGTNTQERQRQQQHVLSQVPLGHVSNLGTPAGAAAAGSRAANGTAGLFSTPAAGLKGPLGHLQQQQQQQTPLDCGRGPSSMGNSRQPAFSAAAAAGLAGRSGFPAAAHRGSATQTGGFAGGLSPAAAAAAPWNAPLTADEAQLDKFDLVNWKVFGHRSFRPQQKDIVMQAAAGRDLFVLMPTGGGKSLCYQVGLLLMMFDARQRTTSWQSNRTVCYHGV
jgi:hypothetical protein